MNLEKTFFNRQEFLKCISYLHKTRIKVNIACMLKKLKKHYKGNVLSLEKTKNDPHSRGVKLFPGVPVICKVNNKELKCSQQRKYKMI